MRPYAAAILAPITLGGAVQAGLLVQVEITGAVQFNQVTDLPLSLVMPGDDVTVTFTLDASSFVDDLGGAERAYLIQPGSFFFTMGSQTLVGQSPLPVGVVPYFVVMDDAPGVDGFFLSTSTTTPNGVPLNVTGQSAQYRGLFSATDDADMLDSPDVLQAVGEYNMSGLTSVTFAVGDGPFSPIGITFDTLSISVVPAPASTLIAAPGLLLGARRRR